MPDSIGIGLLGCGTIGAAVAAAVERGDAFPARVAGLFDADPARAAALSARLPSRPPAHATFEELLRNGSVEVVIEAASAAAAAGCGRAVLASGRSLLIMSSGALIDAGLFAALGRLASERELRLAIPSGAIGGLDAIRAVRAELQELTLTSTKRPAALRGAPGFADWESRPIERATVIYEGPARDAVRLFPANVNVAAAVSLAGLGPDRTVARVVADPDAPGNVHELSASGAFGHFTLRFVNKPSEDNPRTSRLAVLSAIEALRGLCSRAPRIGS